MYQSHLKSESVRIGLCISNPLDSNSDFSHDQASSVQP